MKFRNLIKDDDAVSPVIGVILMVAITVILAAVIGTFVLGLGDQVQTTAPNAQFEFDYNSATGNPSLEITHSGGEGLAGDELYLRGDIENSDQHWQNVGHTEVRAGTSVTVDDSGAGSGVYDWSSGMSYTDGHVPEDTEVRVVWQDSDSDQSSTLRTWSRN